MDPSNKMVSTFAEAGGAIGLVCGLLLISMYIFVRHLMERSKERDAELVELNRQMQTALVSNATTLSENAIIISTLIQVLQQRACLSQEYDTLEDLRKVAQNNRSRKKE